MPLPKSQKKYRTTNINEATYLVLKGRSYTCKPTTLTSAEWIFTGDPTTEKYRREFWSQKGVTVPLHVWLAVRDELKKKTANLFNHQVLTRRNKEIDYKKKKLELTTGDSYYYIDDMNMVRYCLYGKAEVHNDRILKNNIYATKEEAELAQKSKK